uniref:Uncharacterized protein n=1 Tax=Anopheles albimanus TaxID=7167 RepID=A0A182FYF4_ANOAL
MRSARSMNCSLLATSGSSVLSSASSPIRHLIDPQMTSRREEAVVSFVCSFVRFVTVVNQHHRNGPQLGPPPTGSWGAATHYERYN